MKIFNLWFLVKTCTVSVTDLNRCLRNQKLAENRQQKLLFRSNERVVGFGKGNGPVDATVNAIESKVNSKSQLLLFSVNAITDGTQAQGE